MHFNLQKYHVFYWIFVIIVIIITQIGSVPIDKTPHLRPSPENLKEFDLSDSNGVSISTITTPKSSTTLPPSSEPPYRRLNFKLIIILLAAIVFLISTVRICFMIGRSSRSVNNLIPSRRTATPHPPIATITQHIYKPDLPPDYREAVMQIDNEENKLPSYAELHRREQENDTYM